MRKFCYLLSILGHALALLIVLGVRFPITIPPDPPCVVAVRIAKPPLPYVAEGVPGAAQPGSGTPAHAKKTTGSSAADGMAPGTGTGPSPSRGGLSFSPAGRFSLRTPVAGSFRLAPVGKTPDPWAISISPEPPPRLPHFHADVYRSGAASGGGVKPRGVFLLPFDIRERAVADWTKAVMVRIERNWIIPASGHLAFSGRVQITLTIDRRGTQRALVIDDSSVPAPLTLAALHAVKASLPLPPLPENIAGDTFVFNFVFSYNG